MFLRGDQEPLLLWHSLLISNVSCVIPSKDGTIHSVLHHPAGTIPTLYLLCTLPHTWNSFSFYNVHCLYHLFYSLFLSPLLLMQGGHFDLPDRMFHSIPEAWKSASLTNMADVKELIPEFFYLSEFLLNSNNFDLGELPVPEL